MGAALSVSTADVVQKAVNQTYQSAKNSCVTTCNQNMDGNVVIIDNSKVGDITFTQKCSADSSCYMNNAVDAVVETFQDIKLATGAAPSLYPGIQVNVTDSSTEQDIRNELTQVLENICQSNVNQNITNGIVYATDSTAGNIGFVQEGDASARCTMENAARLQLQMRQTGDVTSKTGAAATGLGGLIAIVIVILIVLFVMRKIKKNQSEQEDPNAPKDPNNPNASKNGLPPMMQGLIGGSRTGGAKTASGKTTTTGISSFKSMGTRGKK